MNKLSRTAAVSVAAALGFFAGTDARAAGIGLDVNSGRGTGMASAVTATIDDSSAIYYNPAGIAQGRIIDAQIGDTMIIPSFKYTAPGGGSTSNAAEVIPPFHAYVAGGITDDLSLGVGVFTPYGSTIHWPDGWVGRSIVTRTNLATYDINPTVAYHFGPLRIGAGVQVVRATVDLKKQVATGTQEISTELGGSAWGVGANVGAQVEVVKQYLSLGVHYRSAVKFNFDDGKAHFDNVPPELQATFRDQTGSTSLTNPDSLAIAVASRPIPQLVLDAEVVWTGWSKVRSIDINFPSTAALNTSEAKNWSNTLNYRVGGELAVSDAWRVRAGVLYDPTPSPANTLLPDIPDGDRLNFAVGAGYAHSSGLYVDVGYQFLVLFKNSSSAAQFRGDYSGIVNLLSISVGYRTPKRQAAAGEPPALPPVDVTTPPAPPPAELPPPPPPASPAPPPPAPPAPEAPHAAPPAPPIPAPPASTTPSGGTWFAPPR